MKIPRVLLLALAVVFIPGQLPAETTTCYPQAGGYNTGSTDGVTKTRNSYIACFSHEDGWAKFATTDIPDHHRIHSVDLHFYVEDYSHLAYFDLAITPLTCNPVTADAATIHQDIVEDFRGTLHAVEDTIGIEPYQWHSLRLAGDICVDMAETLDRDWIAIGFAKDGGSTSYYIGIHGWNQTNTLYLTVEHDGSSPTTWHVDDDAPGDPGHGNPDVSDPLEDGSPEHPFDAIAEALAAATTGDTILLADGFYSGTGNNYIEFQGKAVTLRSQNGPEDCVVDGQGWTMFVLTGLEGSHTTLEGITIRNASRGIRCFRSFPTLTGLVIEGCEGGGLSCSQSMPVITDCLFRNNHAWSGGAIYCLYYSSPVITGCTITGNSAWSRGGGISSEFSTFSITDCTISGNEADSGGGIYSNSFQGVINNCVISDNVAENNGGGYWALYSKPTIMNCTFSGNSAARGAGVNLGDYDPTPDERTTVLNNVFMNNQATGVGGGLRSSQGVLEIRGNTFTGNSASYGGAMGIVYAEGTITGNLILDNQASQYGGGLYGHNDQFELTNNLLANNRAAREGGALYCNRNSLAVANCTFTGNAAPGTGGGAISCHDSKVYVSSSILWNDSPDETRTVSGMDPIIDYSVVDGGYWGQGNSDADPLFVTGPLGLFYLSQSAAGQPADSPGLDAGDPAGAMVDGTTRTDAVQDQGVVDMGYHYPLTAAPLALAIGLGPAPGNPPQVRLFYAIQDAHPAVEFSAYGASQYGVNVTTGDITGSGSDHVLTGAGPGAVYGPHVRGFYPDGTPLPGLSFLAYGTSKYGVNVAAGDLDADGFDEIITGAGPGAVFGPHVRGWDYDGSGTVSPMAGISYFAYGTPKWGVNVACGDIDGDGYEEIVTGPGPGEVYGPHVRGWNVDGGSASALPAVSFFAYGTNTHGVNVTCGDVDGDGIDEIITGPGPGAVFGTHIRGWNYDGQTLSDMSSINFFAWAHALASYGAEVFAGSDLDSDGRDEILVGCGPDPDVGTPVKVYRHDGSGVILWFSLEAFEGMSHGTSVAAGRF